MEIMRPIPRQEPPDTTRVALIPQEDPLVRICELDPDEMICEPRYWMQGIPGAIPRIYVRKQVADRLREASRLLPAGYKLKIFDAWRPAAVQRSLFYGYYEQLKADPANAGCSEEQLMAMTRLFVSFPSDDPKTPFVHSTGGAVDLTIVDENGKELDMGTDFDDFTDAAYAAFFEDSDNTVVRDNRRLLFNIMNAAGFTGYPCEWWHFDYGDRFWAAINQTHSVYTGIYEEPELP